MVRTLRCDPVLRVAVSALVAHPGRRRPDRALLRVLATVHHLWRVLHLRNALLAFLLASLWAGYRAGQLSGRKAGWLGLAAGLLGGVAVANRPQLILNLAVLVVPLLFRLRRQALALAGIVAGSALILAGTALHNSAAAGKPTGLSENAGLNFWIGQCDVHDVTTVDPVKNITFQFGNPVWAQLGGAAPTTSRDAWYGIRGSSTRWACGVSKGTASVTFGSWPGTS